MVRDGPHWRLAEHVRPDTDFFARFVSDHWDEALNPSDYDILMRGGMERNIRERTALILWRYRDEHDRPRPREYFLRLAQELRTYFGADYGHGGEADELLTIADVCFPGASRTMGPSMPSTCWVTCRSIRPSCAGTRPPSPACSSAARGSTPASPR